MLFNSAAFLLFFTVVYLLYWRLGHRKQNLLLLAASLTFYAAWNHKLVHLIVLSGTIDYFAALGIERSREARKRKLWLIASVASNLSILGFFKYYNFFAESLNELFVLVGLAPGIHTLDILLPVGISFYTFQSMSYTIDVYRGQLTPSRKYLDFLLYVSFFPQLVAGPIERASRLLPRLTRARTPLSTARRLSCLKLALVGYFQKVFIADTLAPISDGILLDPSLHDSLTLLVGLYAFTFQVYCDFSGYSKIARGVAGLLGIELMVNFTQPYFSRSMQELWRRWHISFTTWLRDYLYIPLGGSRRGFLRSQTNLFITLLLSGLWHGASWNFVAWGGLLGVYLTLNRVLSARRTRDSEDSKALRTGQILLTFHLFVFSLLFFRITDTQTMLAALDTLFSGGATWSLELVYVLLFGFISMALDFLLERQRLKGKRHLVSLFSRNWLMETVCVTAMLLAVLLIGQNDAVPFVYFQF